MRNMPIDEKLSFFSRAGVWVGGLLMPFSRILFAYPLCLLACLEERGRADVVKSHSFHPPALSEIQGLLGFGELEKGWGLRIGRGGTIVAYRSGTVLGWEMKEFVGSRHG